MAMAKSILSCGEDVVRLEEIIVLLMIVSITLDRIHKSETGRYLEGRDFSV